MSAPRLATILSGSCQQGLVARLQTDLSAVRMGQCVVIVSSDQTRFLALISDITLHNHQPQIYPAAAELLLDTAVYATLSLTPVLMSNGNYKPVKTLPAPFSPVYAATATDFAQVFGAPNQSGQFEIGQPPDLPEDLSAPVCLDLARFVARSNGIFGKSGTGKSFLTRLVLAGIIQANVAVNLIFDMHSEYGWEAATATGTVKGLRQLFGSRVQVFSLDPASSRRRGVRDAQPFQISYRQIEIEDLALLRSELNLAAASVETATILRNELGIDWLLTFLAMTATQISSFAETTGASKASLQALQRKLNRLAALPYLSADADAVPIVLGQLAAGQHVVLEFGTQASVLSYLLATTIVTRRIHHAYVAQSETYLYSKNPADRPRPLVITLEEAHRFLAPQIAQQTIFGTIARELRKYAVTLLVVDQRPGSIDSDVLSQLGTRLVASLTDSRDLEAVCAGVAEAATLRLVLAKLDPQQQMLVFGHAVPLPMVVECRPYDAAFYRAIAPELPTPQQARADLGL